MLSVFTCTRVCVVLRSWKIYLDLILVAVQYSINSIQLEKII